MERESGKGAIQEESKVGSMSSTQLYPGPTEVPAPAVSLVAEVPNTDEKELPT